MAAKPLSKAEFQQIYQVGELLGTGGMGEVRRALQLRLKRPVAIKVLKGDAFRREEILSRFLREAKLLAALSHPGVLQVFDFGLLEARPFLVTELLSGGSLADLLAREGRLSPERTLEVLLPIAQALAYLHREKILHRDLKPENILFDASGAPKLTDFGLSRDLDSSTVQTAAGAIMGSPHYVAPEILRGSAADYRSDVYSFGTTLYRALAGATPYSAGTGGVPGLLKQKLAGPPVPIRDRVTGIPAGLARVVDRAMAMEAADRYPSAAELVGPMKVSAGSLEAAREAAAEPGRSPTRPMAALGGSVEGTQEPRTGPLASPPPEHGPAGWRFLLASIALVSACAALYLLVTPRAIALETASAEVSFTRATLRYTTDRECPTVATVRVGRKVKELAPGGPAAREHRLEAVDLPMGTHVEWRPILGQLAGPLQTFKTLSGPISGLRVRRRIAAVEVRATTAAPGVLRLESALDSVGSSAPTTEGREHTIALAGLDPATGYTFRLSAEFAGGEIVEAGQLEVPSVEEWLDRLGRSVEALDVRGFLSRLQLGMDVQRRPRSWGVKTLAEAIGKIPELARLETFEGLVGELAAQAEARGVDRKRVLFKMLNRLDQLDHAAVALGLDQRTGARRLLGPKYWVSRASRLAGVNPAAQQLGADGKLLIVRLIGQLVNILDTMDTERPKDVEAVGQFTIPASPRPRRAELGLLLEGVGAGTELEIRFGESSASLFVWDPEGPAAAPPKRMLYCGFDPALLPAGPVTVRVRASTLPAAYQNLGVRLFRMELRLE